jgi:hypothetical protein
MPVYAKADSILKPRGGECLQLFSGSFGYESQMREVECVINRRRLSSDLTCTLEAGSMG